MRLTAVYLWRRGVIGTMSEQALLRPGSSFQFTEDGWDSTSEDGGAGDTLAAMPPIPCYPIPTFHSLG
jgi:hypothetical protein